MPLPAVAGWARATRYAGTARLEPFAYYFSSFCPSVHSRRFQPQGFHLIPRHPHELRPACNASADSVIARPHAHTQPTRWPVASTPISCRSPKCWPTLMLPFIASLPFDTPTPTVMFVMPPRPVAMRRDRPRPHADPAHQMRRSPRQCFAKAVCTQIAHQKLPPTAHAPPCKPP